MIETTLPILASVDVIADPDAVVAFFSFAGLMALFTLTVLEIVLGIDNVVFIAILADKLPEEKQKRTRTIGLLLAMVMRLILLAVAFLIVKLTTPLFTVFDHDISGKSLLLLGGGLFLIAKAVLELHHLIEEGTADRHAKGGPTATVAKVLVQILVLDLVFSLDSVITAVGMTTNYWIMASAVVISIIVMLAFASPIADFVNRHPTMKTLALSFLVLIGILLVAEGIGEHFNRGYIYFAIVFAFILELINMKIGSRKAKQYARAHPAEYPSNVDDPG
jgi:predicted tellurium resistance membrane protein TerC